jgi:hypothetical protein
MIKTPWSPQTVKIMDDLLGSDLDDNGVDPNDVKGQAIGTMAGCSLYFYGLVTIHN